MRPFSPAAMDEKFGPLRFDQDCLVVQSVPKTARIPLGRISALPHIGCIPRDLIIGTRERPVRSPCVLSWLRGELDEEQAAVVEKMLGDKGRVETPVSVCATPSDSHDNDIAQGCTALLALRGTDGQAAEVNVQT